MMRPDESFDDQLLAYHMGWLDRAQMDAVERLIAARPQAAARSRELQQGLESLADWTALPAVDDLETQILRRVQRESGGGLAAVAGVARLSPVPARSARVLHLPLSLREALAIAACVGILVVIVLPSLARASALSQRSACAENLRQLSSALAQYSHDYSEQLPFAGTSGNWLHGGPDRNSRNRFLLAALGYVGDAGRFVCPADREGVIMRTNDFARFADFPEPQNCSYDSQIMSGRGLSGVRHPQMVVYSDSNPVFDVGRDMAGDRALSNSLLHRSLSGQNVMRADGSVNWATSPEVGVQNDNIWQIGGRRTYAGPGAPGPESPTDSFMVP